MNMSMIIKLIVKDWQLYKWFMGGYALLAIMAAGAMTLPSELAYYTGFVVLVTVLIGASAHIVFSSIVIEKKEYQLSFIMGLPINPLDYTLSKVVGGLVIYMACWATAVVATLLSIYLSEMPNGLIPMMIISATEILVATTILLCVGITFGSEASTIIVMVLLNLFFNVFLFSVTKLPGINMHIESENAVFNPTVFAILGAEIGLIILFVLITTYYRSRKACFF